MELHICVFFCAYAYIALQRFWNQLVELSHGDLQLLFRRRIERNDHDPLLAFRALERLQLAVQHVRLHVVPLPPRYPPPQQVALALDVHKVRRERRAPGRGARPAEDVAVVRAEGGARDEDAAAGVRGGALGGGAEEREPGLAVRVGERDAGGHLGDVRGGVERVALDEGEAEPGLERVRERRLAGPGDTL